MSKAPTLWAVLSGFMSASKVQTNFDRIVASFGNTLSLDGSTPNSMLSNLDFNSNRAINVAFPVDNYDAANKLYVDNASFSSAGSYFYDTLAQLRATTTAVDAIVFVTDELCGGFFILDPDDHTSTDNNGTVVVNTNGNVFKRQYSGPANIEWFGAVGTTGFDNTAALNAAFGSGLAVYVPNKTFEFLTPLTTILHQGPTISGSGCLLYTGVATNPTALMTVGNGTDYILGPDFRGFRIASATPLTDGCALRMRNCVYVEIDLKFDGTTTIGNYLFDGVRFEGTSIINMHSSRFIVINNGITAYNGVELHLGQTFIQGAVSGSGTGIHIAGGFGGLYTEHLTQILNNLGLLVDCSLSAAGNTQMFLGPHSTFDSNTSWCVYLNDAVTNAIGKSVELNCWMATSSAGGGLAVINWAEGTIESSAGISKNHSGHGILVFDSTVVLTLGSSVNLTFNHGYAIFASPPLEFVCSVPYNTTNTLGFFSPLARPRQEVNAPPAQSWGLDFTPCKVTVANGANAPLAAGGGLLIAQNDTNGDVGAFIVGGSSVILLGTTGATWVSSTTPAAGKTGIAWNGSNYTLYNNFGSGQTFIIGTLKTRIQS